jgi:polysaccharide biosynthesis protein PslH
MPTSFRRVLFISPFPPRADGIHGGARAIAHLLTEISDRFEVGLICFRAESEPPVDSAIVEKCAFVEEVRREVDRGHPVIRFLRIVRLMAGALRGVPTWAGAFSSPKFVDAFLNAVSSWKPDVVQAEFHVMGQYALKMRRTAEGRAIPFVLVEHEPGVQAASEAVYSSSARRRWLERIELAAWQHFEPRVLRAASAVVAFTEKDRQTLQHLASDVDPEVIPLAIPISEEPLSVRSESKGEIVFIGNFAHPPNREAAFRLIEEIMPAVRARRSEATLTLVGHQPDGEIEQRAGGGIHVTGRVPDVLPYLQSAAVVAVPLFTGGGMRVKVLEALAAGKAVVATPLAVEGLDVVNGEHAIIADDSLSLGSRIAELLEDEGERVALGRRARKWAERRISVAGTADAFTRLYERLVVKSSIN